MKINFEDETNVNFDFDYRKIAEKVCDTVLDEEDFPYESEVEILFTGSEEIREINRENRGIDSETDVLSFPLLNLESPGNFGNLEQDMSIVDPDTGNVCLGDMVLCIPRIKSQAKEYGHSELREYAFLICHSMLHLLGYDHIEEDDRKIMEEKQRVIMERLDIRRD